MNYIDFKTTGAFYFALIGIYIDFKRKLLKTQICKK